MNFGRTFFNFIFHLCRSRTFKPAPAGAGLRLRNTVKYTNHFKLAPSGIDMQRVLLKISDRDLKMLDPEPYRILDPLLDFRLDPENKYDPETLVNHLI